MQTGTRLGLGLAVWLSLAASPALAQSATASAPAADFGTGAAACTVALAPTKLDETALKKSGWAISSTHSIATIYQRDGVGVRLFLSTMIAPSGQCVVDGYATADDQFAAIRDAIRAALTEKYGAPPMMPAPVTPSGQGFVVDNNLVLILSAEKRPAGLSIRITGMRFPKN
jgi:hypothetical protein